MRNNLKKMDITLFICVLIISLFGCVMIYSASSVSTILRYDEPTWYFFSKQLIIVAMMYLFVFPIVITYPTKKYSIWVSILMVLCIISLLGLFVFAGLTNSARSWYTFSFFSLQPSEFAKSMIIIITAVLYNKISKIKRQSFQLYLPVLGYGALATFLVAAQPDLGSAIILAGIVCMMFSGTRYVASNIKNVIIGCTISLLLLLALFLGFKDTLLTENQLLRFTFSEPCTRISESTGYQVCNGYIAINNGGLFGVGFGNSTQKYLYLPESHTDFIFPIIVEEVGLIVSIAVLLIYVIILWRLIVIARQSHNLRQSLLAYGTFWFISLHVIVNLCGVLALLPLTGVPLPFLSYGGSSIMNCLLMTFVALRVSIENKEENIKNEMKEIKGENK